MEREYPHLVNDIRLNPNTGVGGRDNFDICLGDKVREDLLDRVRHDQSRRFDREASGSDGDGQSLSICDVESLCLDIGLGHSVVDCGRDGLKLSKITTTENCIRDVKAHLGVSDGEDLGLDRLVGNCHSRRGRTILARARDQASANANLWITQRKVDLLCVTPINDDRGLITTPAIVVSPLEKKKNISSISKNCTTFGRLVPQAGAREQE